ncbi:hypothetical protein LZ30DRAFT_686961 [Colletotrichum cereale]|nr:hypothetical protein LZ30DRAFT_686961 [Colletotrichum cereale]
MICGHWTHPGAPPPSREPFVGLLVLASRGSACFAAWFQLTTAHQALEGSSAPCGVDVNNSSSVGSTSPGRSFQTVIWVGLSKARPFALLPGPRCANRGFGACLRTEVVCAQVFPPAPSSKAHTYLRRRDARSAGDAELTTKIGPSRHVTVVCAGWGFKCDAVVESPLRMQYVAAWFNVLYPQLDCSGRGKGPNKSSFANRGVQEQAHAKYGVHTWRDFAPSLQIPSQGLAILPERSCWSLFCVTSQLEAPLPRRGLMRHWG